MSNLTTIPATVSHPDALPLAAVLGHVEDYLEAPPKATAAGEAALLGVLLARLQRCSVGALSALLKRLGGKLRSNRGAPIDADVPRLLDALRAQLVRKRRAACGRRYPADRLRAGVRECRTHGQTYTRRTTW